MTITKCDRCKKVISEKAVIASFGFLSRAELCEKCGSPILKLLKKYKFLKIDEKLKKK